MVVFLMHIPKTAGKTLQSIVRNNYADDEVFFTYPPRRTQLAHHPRLHALKIVMGHFRFGVHAVVAPRPFAYFKFLRDPVAQVASHYGHIQDAETRAHAERDAHMAIKREYGALAEFAGHPWACNLQTQYLTGWSSDKIREAPDQAFDLATENLEHHFLGIGITERFDESLLILRDCLSWENLSYTARNVARQPVRVDDLDPGTVALIKENNEVDGRVYEYGLRRRRRL